MSFDDVKVACASVTGLGNWMLDIDTILKVGISLATLVYIILKIRKLLKETS